MVEQTGSSFRNLIFEKALGASITCKLQGICIVRMIPKTIQKWIIILSKTHQNPGLETPKSKSGGLWGRFGGVLGNLGPSWTFVEASWTVLEASWKRLGSLLGRLGGEKGGQHGSKVAPKTEAKSIKNQSKNRSVVRCHLESPFVGFPPIFGIKNRTMLVRKCIEESTLS